MRTLPFTLLLALTACTGKDGMPPEAPTTPEPTPVQATDDATPDVDGESEIGGEWVLSEAKGVTLPEDAKRPTLSIAEDGSVTGFAGVNRLHGKLQNEPGEPIFGPMATTRMAGPPPMMGIEASYLDLLARVDSVAIDDGQLVLSEGGAPQLRFDRP